MHLVVDDNELNLTVIKMMIEHGGHSVIAVSCAQDAIDLIKDGQTFDIIWMDVKMPKINGIECTKILRSMNYKNKIYGLTGYDTDDVIKECLNAGMDLVCSKPITCNRIAELSKIDTQVVNEKSRTV